MLNSAFSDIVKKFNTLQLSNHSKASISEGNIILSTGVELLNQLKNYTKSLETLLSDCQDFIKEVEDDLSKKPHKEDFVYHTSNGMLSYLGRDLIVKNADSKNTSNESKISNPVTIERVLIPEIGYYMRLPVIQDVRKIPPMFYWYKGDTQHSAGIYCCLIPGVFAKVPFPEIIDSTKEYNKGRSIRCKYRTKALCDDQRSKMAQYHDSQVRICNFAHTGEKIVKIGYPSRCAQVPNFGNPSSITNDIKSIDEDAIKNILMYGLNDIAVAAIYLDYTKINSASGKSPRSPVSAAANTTTNTTANTASLAPSNSQVSTIYDRLVCA